MGGHFACRFRWILLGFASPEILGYNKISALLLWYLDHNFSLQSLSVSGYDTYTNDITGTAVPGKTLHDYTSTRTLGHSYVPCGTSHIVHEYPYSLLVQKPTVELVQQQCKWVDVTV